MRAKIVEVEVQGFLRFESESQVQQLFVVCFKLSVPCQRHSCNMRAFLFSELLAAGTTLLPCRVHCSPVALESKSHIQWQFIVCY